MADFYDLEIWKKGYELVLKIYEITAKYPAAERYGLTAQTRDAANSIIANIAESFGRYYFADKVRVLLQARGELAEVRSHLRVAVGLKYLDQATFAAIDHDYRGLEMGLNAYIKSLRRSTKR